MDALLRSSAFGHAVQGQFEESFEIVDSFTVDPKNLPEGTVIGKSIKPTEVVTGKVSKAPAIDLDSLLQTSVSGEAVEGDFEEAIEVVDSFTVDPKNLPEGTVIGKSIKPTEAVTGQVDTAPVIDLDSLLQTSVSGEAVAGDFEESFEIVDSFTVDPRTCLKAP